MDDAPNGRRVNPPMSFGIIGRNFGNMASGKGLNNICVADLCKDIVERVLGEWSRVFHWISLELSHNGHERTWFVVSLIMGYFMMMFVCLRADPRTENVSASGNSVALVREPGALTSPVPLAVLFAFVPLPHVRRCCSDIECS